MRALCRLGIHRWGNWGPKFHIPDARYAFEFQQRTCSCCGYVQERSI